MEKEYKLSICMMVKDEEKNLDRCLKSLMPLLDEGIAELIIVDTGSKDKTPDIAKSYTNNVYYHAWNNNFSDMRNISISYAKGEWIFIIDADERLDNPCELINIFKQEDALETYNTILMEVKSIVHANDEKRFTCNISARIFKDDGTFKYEGSVHNQPMFKKPLLKIGAYITHFGYIAKDKQLMENKFIRTSSLIKNELEKNPDNLYYRYQLATSYDMHGDKKEALEEIRNTYRILKSRSKQERYSYAYIYCTYARILNSNKKYIEAIDICKEGIKLRYDYIDLYYLCGISEKCLGNIDEAHKYFLKYIDLIDKYNELTISRDLTIVIYTIDVTSKSNVYFNIVEYYLDNGDLKKADFYCNKIDNKVQRAFMTIKTLIMLNDYIRLRDYYLTIEDSKIKDYFLSHAEEEINKLGDDEKTKFYSEFSSCDDTYGLFNRMRNCCDEDSHQIAIELLNKIDFDKDPAFYYKIFLKLLNNRKEVISVFKRISTYRIRNIVKFLLDESEDTTMFFEDYLQAEHIRANDLQANRVYIAIALIMLTERIDNTNEVNDNYYNIFKLYIERGINLVSQMYHMEKARVIYKDVSNDEDRFFILMYIVNDYISRGNLKTSVKYLMEALDCNKYMAKYIDLYKDEVFGLISEGE